MSSAVESFGPASAAAAHPYAHHNPFAIAAAAAAAGSAAAAAAAVMPSHHHHHHLHHQSMKTEPGQEHQFVLNHSSIYNNISISAANSHNTNSHLGISGSDLFLPPRPPPLSLTSSSAIANILPTPLALSSKTCSPQELPNSPQNRSPRSKATKFQGQDGICSSNNMSSAEFARPHPKQPRYNNNNNVNTTNNNINSHLNNNNYTSNAIPLHLRSTNTATNLSKGYNHNNNNNCLNNNNIVLASDKNINNSGSSKTNNSNIVNKTTIVAMPRAKYSNEQSGPVNLVTTNNINSMNHNNNNNNKCRTPPSSIPTEVIQISPSSSEGSDCSRKSATSEMYAQKMPFTAQSLAATNNAAVAAAAAAFQYNYPHMYASRALYGNSALFSGHHALVHHNTLRPCPTYLGGQHEAFAPYLQAAGVYSPSVPANATPQSNVSLLRTTPQVLLNNSNNNGLGVVATQPSSPLERNTSYPQSSPKDISNMNGTYLNGKVNNSPAAPESISGFKVPSGKEGSLKHRILTRPAVSDRETTKEKSQVTAAVVRSNSNSSTSNFTKGAYIELSNGVLRRVEDMRTEDFIHSAEKSAFHQLAESTVVKISATQSGITITFSYGKNRSKADVEVSHEHPFFVYGQGWASCNPELTLKSFGLKCQRLQVGDICISLISREQQQQPLAQAQQQQPLAQAKQEKHQNQMSANCYQQAPQAPAQQQQPLAQAQQEKHQNQMSANCYQQARQAQAQQQQQPLVQAQQHQPLAQAQQEKHQNQMSANCYQQAPQAPAQQQQPLAQAQQEKHQNQMSANCYQQARQAQAQQQQQPLVQAQQHQPLAQAQQEKHQNQMSANCYQQARQAQAQQQQQPLVQAQQHQPLAQAQQEKHQNQMSANCYQQAPSQNFDKSELISLPQNLSIKLLPPPTAENTIPFTNAVSSITNRLASMGAPTYIPNSHHHHPYEEAAAYENTISRHHEFYQPPLHLHHPYHRLLGHTEVTSRLPLPPPPPQSHSASMQKSRLTSNQSTYYPEPHHSPIVQISCNNETQQQPVDASLSRKRRWSAPESICDDDENECKPPSIPRLSSNVNAYNS